MKIILNALVNDSISIHEYYCYLLLTPQKIKKRKKKKKKKSQNTRGYIGRKPRIMPKLVVNDQNNKWKS